MFKPHSLAVYFHHLKLRAFAVTCMWQGKLEGKLDGSV